jgi:hypothetical protein
VEYAQQLLETLRRVSVYYASMTATKRRKVYYCAIIERCYCDAHYGHTGEVFGTNLET